MCQECGDPSCNGVGFNISVQNTAKFVDEIRYLCKFARDGNVHPALTAILTIFNAVINENITTNNEQGLKDFYGMCFEYAKKHKKELGG